MGKYCKRCKKSFEENDEYCSNCGAKLIDSEDGKYDSERVRKKVKFSHQFLIPKLMVIGIFRLSFVSDAIDQGAMLVLTGEGWIDLITWVCLTILFSAWFTQNMVNYSGSEYLITFGIEKETLGKIENILKIIEKIYPLIVGMIYAIFFIKRSSLDEIFNVFLSFELFPIFWEIFTYIVLTLYDVKKFILILYVIDSLRNIASVYRVITKKDLEKFNEDFDDWTDNIESTILDKIIRFLDSILDRLSK